jgi:hypothetical protein
MAQQMVAFKLAFGTIQEIADLDVGTVVLRVGSLSHKFQPHRSRICVGKLGVRASKTVNSGQKCCKCHTSRARRPAFLNCHESVPTQKLVEPFKKLYVISLGGISVTLQVSGTKQKRPFFTL